MNNQNTRPLQKIIHIDMDCFYAAVEIRDNPSLANRPVAVGGSPERRGVLCTCNYIARQYGIHSAMATSLAYKKCPDLIVLPVNMSKYRQVAKNIQNIFHQFTNLVEPLALDEAYLDVTNCESHNGSATLIAEEIRKLIWQQEQLRASAGVAPNKFLAKIASGWNKPNGLFVIAPHQVKSFLVNLPVNKLFGVGKVTEQKLQPLHIKTCSDLEKFSLPELTNLLGKMGHNLYYQSRGIDKRKVDPNRVRKSLSVETTFAKDLTTKDQALTVIENLYPSLIKRINDLTNNYMIKNQYLKIKWGDFSRNSAESAATTISLEKYQELLLHLYKQTPIRLIGIGVHFKNAEEDFSQQSLFD